MKCELLVTICFLKAYVVGHCRDHERDDVKTIDQTRLILTARYLVHTSDWVAVATISAAPEIRSFPFINLKCFSDGSFENSTGVPYFYMSILDATYRDLRKNSRATIMLALPDHGTCDSLNNPDDIKCLKIMLNGQIRRVPEGTKEYVYARASLFERHPFMSKLSASEKHHEWFVTKMYLVTIGIVDWIGDINFIRVNDYLNYKYPGNEQVEKYLTSFNLKVEPPTTEEDTSQPSLDTADEEVRNIQRTENPHLNKHEKYHERQPLH